MRFYWIYTLGNLGTIKGRDRSLLSRSRRSLRGLLRSSPLSPPLYIYGHALDISYSTESYANPLETPLVEETGK